MREEVAHSEGKPGWERLESRNPCCLFRATFQEAREDSFLVFSKMFERGKRYKANVLFYPCCGAPFCNCRASVLVLTVVKVSPTFVYLKKIPEMRGEAVRKCKVRNGSSFRVELVDNGDRKKRFVKTTVYSSDVTSDDEDDHTPLSVLSKRL